MHSNYLSRRGEYDLNPINFRPTKIFFKIIVSRIPFDWKTPFGYVIAVAIQFFIVVKTLQCDGCLLSIALAGFTWAMSIGRDLKRILSSINENLMNQQPRYQIQKQLIEFIDLHSRLKELSVQCTQRNKCFFSIILNN